jgi:hypothetical protein
MPVLTQILVSKFRGTEKLFTIPKSKKGGQAPIRASTYYQMSKKNGIFIY